MFAGQKILVTGGTGLIGREVVKLLLKAGARVRVTYMRDLIEPDPGVEYIRGDLMNADFCRKAAEGTAIVFHLASIKGSVGVGRKCAADFFVKPMLMNTHMMEEARKAGVERYLFCSSICVYAPAKIFLEDKAWDGPPQPADSFAGWAKRMGEMQAEAYREQYGWNNVYIVRPVNIFGPYDNFDPQTAQVIPALIHRALSGENPLKVWGDGSAVRDFLFTRDCARGLLLAMEKGTSGVPINLGSGIGYSIRQIVSEIIDVHGKSLEVVWDTSKPSGESYRVADVTRAREMLGFSPMVSLKDAISETYQWYSKNRRLGVRESLFTK
jgi:GDP-L-fucose synthase